MTENPHSPRPKVDPESLVLRGSPRRVTRFRRNLFIGAAGVGAVALFTLLGFGLSTTRLRPQANNQELYNVERKTTAEGLAALPANYGEAKAAEPKLGPPLPGDLGPPVVAQERALGLSENDYQQNAEENDARAERIRLAQQKRRAKEASVFFQLSQSRAMETPAAHSGGQDPGAGAYGQTSPGRLALDLDTDQNNQQRKLDFINQPGQRSSYNAFALEDAASPFQVMSGSVISASLITGINSDLPGLVVAQVTENIFDTVSGKYLLIPQGSRLIGSYDSVVAFGQSRALLVWQRIVMPNGSSIQIENLPATDTSGYAGLRDEVDFHTWQLLKGVVLSTLLGVGTELSLGSDESDLVRAIRESTQQNVNRAGQRVTEKNLNLQPTITVRPGWLLRVIVHKDLILRPYKG